MVPTTSAKPIPAASQSKLEPLVTDRAATGDGVPDACVWNEETLSGATSTPPIWTRCLAEDWPAWACQDDSCAGTTSCPPIWTYRPGLTAAAAGAATAATRPVASTSLSERRILPWNVIAVLPSAIACVHRTRQGRGSFQTLPGDQ